MFILNKTLIILICFYLYVSKAKSKEKSKWDDTKVGFYFETINQTNIFNKVIYIFFFFKPLSEKANPTPNPTAAKYLKIKNLNLAPTSSIILNFIDINLQYEK